MNDDNKAVEGQKFNNLAQHPVLAIRQAVADQYHSPQRNNGTLCNAIERSAENGSWATGFDPDVYYAELMGGV